jgi:hypothetical protein
MSETLDPDFLAQYERESDWAKAHGISQRTAARYRALPNGLPFLFFGGWVWIPKREGQEWIASRVKRRRNPRRQRQLVERQSEAAAS